jgi:1-acyl-sn-glycerol-3-phosphate acyltransferase
MKITDIVYKSYDEVKALPQFDLQSMPKKPKWYLQLLAWVLAFPETFKVKPKIRKHNMEGVKGPFIMLCNHNSFLDFKIATRAVFPKRSTYIVAVDGFIGREGIMRNVGCFAKRKFFSDSVIVRQIRHSIEENKVICQIYPEARYSLVGTNSELPDALSKLIKMTGYPVVTLVSHGHHLYQPFWNLKNRKVKTSTDMTYILSPQQIKDTTVQDITKIINTAFTYDDYRYQVDNDLHIKESFRAEGLHKPLFMCPHCETEHQMDSKDNTLFCKK